MEPTVSEILRELQESGFKARMTAGSGDEPSAFSQAEVAHVEAYTEHTEANETNGSARWMQLNQALLRAGFAPVPLQSASDALPQSEAGLTASPTALRDIIQQVGT